MTETPRLVLAYRAILAEAERLSESKKAGPRLEAAADRETDRASTGNAAE